MHSQSRRQVLRALGAMGTCTLLLPRKARATPFGSSPTPGLRFLDEDRHVQSILEIFLYGGLSQWESFYFVPELGKKDKRFYYAFAGTENEAALEACGITEQASQLFARDGLGVDVHIGPFARALFSRPDLLDRMRIVVQQHNLLPHEAAIPYGMTGKLLGSPNLCSLGAHVQRAFTERATRTVPYSFALMTSQGVSSDNVDAFVATGTHPGSSRPLSLKVDQAERLQTLLARPAVAPEYRQAYDAYLAARIRTWRSRLRYRGTGEALRSAAIRDLEAAARSVANTDAVTQMLPQEVLTVDNVERCGQRRENVQLAGLRLATHLLTHPDTPCRYVSVLDTGLVQASGGGGYDTHASDEQIVQLTNLDNLLSGLASMINLPGEQDPQKLDLDRTLVILNTEFGRTPDIQPDAGGRNHHPAGYTTVFLGGPAQGRSIQGAIDSSGVGKDAVTPAENRIAALLAMGVYPFSPDGFSLSEVPGATTDLDAGMLAVNRVFGAMP